jgi:hypothetical protein
MARQSSFKKGGGFLHEQDGVITGYLFTDEFNGKPYEPGKMKDLKGKMIEKPHSLNCTLSVRPDSAIEDITTPLKVAKDFDAWTVSEDGQTLTPNEDIGLSASSGFGKFVQSWEQAAGQGAEADTIDGRPAEANEFNYGPIIGSRVRFVQKDYTPEELAAIKRLGAPEKRKGKDGKEYNRQSLVVSEVYELAQAASKTNGKAKPVVKAAGKPNGKIAKPEPVEDTPEIPDLAGAALVEMLTKAGKPLAKAKLSMLTLTTPSLKGKPYRDDVREWLFDDDNLDALAEQGAITYNRVKGLLALAE